MLESPEQQIENAYWDAYIEAEHIENTPNPTWLGPATAGYSAAARYFYEYETEYKKWRNKFLNKLNNERKFHLIECLEESYFGPWRVNAEFEV